MEVRSKRIGPRLKPNKAQLCINEREMGSNQAFWPKAKGFSLERTCPKTDHPKTHPRKVESRTRAKEKGNLESIDRQLKSED